MVHSFFATSFLTATPQAVVFDWGKVLADPDRKPILSFLSDSLDLSLEEIENANARKHEKGIPEIEFWVALAKEQGKVTDEWLLRYKKVARASLNVDDGMYALVAELKAKRVPVALLSNISKRYADLIREFGLYSPFKPCLLSGEIGIAKPDPLVFALLLRELAIPASKVVFIDDLPQNIESARKCGLDAILFESHDQLRKELTERNLL